MQIQKKKKRKKERKYPSIINAKKHRKMTEWERPLQENERYQVTISCKDGHNKGQKWYGPNRSRRY